MKKASLEQGFILSKGTFTRDGKVFVELWVKTNTGCARLISEPQQPTCFIKMKEQERLRNALGNLRGNVLFSNDDFSTLDQKNVVTIKVPTESHMRKLRQLAQQQGVTLYEADIRVADRYLMERFVYGAIEFLVPDISTSKDGNLIIENAQIRPCQYRPTFSTLSIDIECDENESLFSVALAGNDISEVILVQPASLANKVVQDDSNSAYTLTVVDNEKTLLHLFFERISSYDPDVILGWNVKQFDMAVIARRASFNNVKFSIGRHQREAQVREWEDQTLVDVPGRSVIDGIESLKTMTYQFESFSLDYVSESLLGENKLIQDSNKLDAIKHLYYNDPISLANYNYKDTVLVNEIQEKTQFLDFLALRGTLTGLDLSRPGGSVAAFLNVYLPKLHRNGYVAGVRPENGGLASPGGYVMHSKPGLYKDVLVLDFKSLYPSIIRTFKIDPMGLAEGLKSPDTAIEGFKGAVFSRDSHFLPDIIENLWLQRDEAKRQHDAPRSQAIKILMNSFYGVLGSGGCPFYDPRLASSITLRGHEIMQTTARWIEELGYTVIYGDTDSTFVHVEGNNAFGTPKKTGKKLADIINTKWHELLQSQFNITCHLEIEFESHFTTFFMPTIRGSSQGSKKRYAGLKSEVKEGKETSTLIFKGLENVRSDWTELAKQFQYTLYQKVFNNEPFKEYIKGTLVDIRQGKLDDQLIYKKRLRKPLTSYTKSIPPHVKAARLADALYEERGEPLRYQTKTVIPYVITVKGPQTTDTATAILDYEHYIEKQIKPIADSILPMVGSNFEQLTNQQLNLF
ncbi:DNA polymerase II [Alteromonas gracilis]|uniref:DNA polymerase II n=1 Tax=Alteromonas gracilis TaxID=1479524 RepID=UPI0030CFCB57